MPRSATSLFLSLVVAVLVVRPAPAAPVPGTLDRVYEPVVVSGAALADFQGAPTSQLWAYAYRSGSWVQIPFQVDQKDASGSYFGADTDPTFDANDEICIMARDMGDQVGADVWLTDLDSQSYERYEVQVIDGTNPSKLSWAYVYRSATLSQTFVADLAGFAIVAGADSVWGEGHSLVYNTGGVQTNARVTLAGGGDDVDVVDRVKIRMTMASVRYTENAFTTRTLAVVDGPVRLLRQMETIAPAGIDTSGTAYYANLDVPFGPSVIDGNVTFLRGSIDLNQSALGMTFYDDFNPAGVPVDGVPDVGVVTTAPSWGEVTGTHGTLIAAGVPSGVGGAHSLYYLDNAAIDSTDTGDQQSIGDSGTQITNPTAPTYPNLVHWTWYLPANIGNVGATYRGYTWNPLAPTGLAQAYQPVAVGGGTSARPGLTAPTATPSVARNAVVVRFALGVPAFVRLEVFDASGRTVRTLAAERFGAGPAAVPWSLTDDAGRLVANGVYTIRLAVGGEERTGRLVVMR